MSDYIRNKKDCDCFLKKEYCYCGVDIAKKPKKKKPYLYDFTEKELLKKKVSCTFSIERGILLDFFNVIEQMGFDNRSLFVEQMMENFIDEIRGQNRKLLIK